MNRLQTQGRPAMRTLVAGRGLGDGLERAVCESSASQKCIQQRCLDASNEKVPVIIQRSCCLHITPGFREFKGEQRGRAQIIFQRCAFEDVAAKVARRLCDYSGLDFSFLCSHDGQHRHLVMANTSLFERHREKPSSNVLLRTSPSHTARWAPSQPLPWP